jgi:hypothetical protein
MVTVMFIGVYMNSVSSMFVGFCTCVLCVIRLWLVLGMIELTDRSTGAFEALAPDGWSNQ